ncbi:MAG: 3-isopropylmalate dehydratase small subunit [Thermoplasmata archaeon]
MKGKAWVIGDNIDTDQIYPGKYLPLTDIKEMAKHALEGIEGLEDFSQRVEKGDFVVAGKNFGCGSSREHAAVCLKEAGVAMVIATSFARIYYRNTVNIGYPVLECEEITKKVNDGDILEVDPESGIIKNERTGETIQASPLSGLEREISDAGGLLQYIKKTTE